MRALAGVGVLIGALGIVYECTQGLPSVLLVCVFLAVLLGCYGYLYEHSGMDLLAPEDEGPLADIREFRRRGED